MTKLPPEFEALDEYLKAMVENRPADIARAETKFMPNPALLERPTDDANPLQGLSPKHCYFPDDLKYCPSLDDQRADAWVTRTGNIGTTARQMFIEGMLAERARQQVKIKFLTDVATRLDETLGSIAAYKWKSEDDAIGVASKFYAQYEEMMGEFYAGITLEKHE